MKRTICGFLTLALLNGCTTMVSYAPKTGSPDQAVTYVQGVGTIAVKNADHEISMYPTFKRQGPAQPTFTIGYANNTAAPVNFTQDNVKAYFRGVQVPIYSYSEKIDEIQTEKRGKQVALAILGGLAAGAAAYGASRQTYTSNYSGAIRGRSGITTFAGSNTLRVYDPMSGILVGSAVAGATGLGVQQLEFNAQNQEEAANAILQENTVDPQRMVSGQVILRGCCDQYPQSNDVIRFEVTANSKVSVFEFDRMIGNSPRPSQPAQPSPVVAVSPVAAPAPRPLTVAFTDNTSSKAATAAAPAVSDKPVVVAVAAPSIVQVGALPVPVTPRPSTTVAVTAAGQDGFNARRLAKDQGCSAEPVVSLLSKGPGFESYTVPCSSGDALAIRCEFGNCRVLQ